jgi:hypothetical protein
MRREPAKSFRDLIVWTGGINAWGFLRRHALQKAHQLVLEVYRFSSSFPQTETYGLVSQLRRALVSVPANIAEGFKKKGLADKVQFLNITQG